MRHLSRAFAVIAATALSLTTAGVAEDQKSPIAPAEPSTAASAKKTATAPAPTAQDFTELYEYGRQLFDDYAPAAVKDQYEFVSQEQWDAFTAKLQKSFEAGSVEDLAALEGDARRTLAALRVMPAYAEYADWLAERLDLIETARLVTHSPTALFRPVAPEADPSPVDQPAQPATPDAPTAPDAPPFKAPALTVTPTPDGVAFVPPARSPVPYYDIWLERIKTRPKPERADELMPVLKVIFASEGLPAELVWLAEVESSLNPSARSPAGARGLFQLMPATARAFGLRTFPFDERTQPGKNARVAAKLLRRLHDRFNSWPLALAAYNAGEGRIAVAQKKIGSTAYADIAEHLPAETHMYVPKVLATLAVREPRVPAALRVPAPALFGGGGTPAALVAD